MQEHSNSLPELFKKNGEELSVIKNSISSIFLDIGNFVVHTSSEIGHFKSMIIPYVEYFYPVGIESADACFINEIVLPGKTEMVNAIDGVLRIMRESEELSDKVSGEVGRILDFQSNIDSILDLFKEIDVFIGNNGIIAEKDITDAGLSEINNMITENADTLSGEMAGFIEELNFELREFNKILNWMHRIHKSYLMQIKSRFDITYIEIIDKIRSSSKNIERLMKHFNDMEGAVINIINSLQIEDIERQNLERVIFLIDDMVKNYSVLEQGVMGKIGPERLENVLFFLIRDKVSSINNGFGDFLGEFGKCFKEVKQVLKDFSQLFESTDSDGIINRGIVDLDTVYRSNSRLGKSFINQVKKIVEMRKKLYELFHRIMRSKAAIEEFLIDILNRNKRLEEINKDGKGNIINSDLGKLISILNEKIESSLRLFENISTNVDRSISEYHYNFLKQGEILQKSVFSIRKASIKFNESLKYNRMISKEILKKTDEITEFIERADDSLFSLREAETVIVDILNDVDSNIVKSGKAIEGSPDSYLDEIGIIKEYYVESGSEGDYKNIMIISFLSEFSEQHKSEIVFF